MMAASKKTPSAPTGRVGDQAQLAPQLYQRVEALKDYVGRKRDLFHDGEAWASHQELQSLFQRLLLLDLDYALDKKAEVDLWNYCFKNYITHLQSAARDRSALKQKQAQEAQVTLSWFLETASGFYLMLLQELREAFRLDLPFMCAGPAYGLTPALNGDASGEKKGDKDLRKEPHVNNCVYLVQHCLVHLGDLARYRSQPRQAEAFYRQAVRVAPGSGQAYNQLALLDANRGERLGAVYFYVRALALKYPFPAAATNLSKMLSRLAEEKGDPPEKLNEKTFVECALRFLALLHHAQHLKRAARLCNKMNESLTSLVASESLSKWTLVQIVAVTLFLMHKDQDEGAEASVSRDEQHICGLASEFVAGLLNSLVLPVYTLKQGEALLDYFALPATKLILEWITLNPRSIEERGFLRRLQIWPGLCRMLNELSELSCDHQDSIGRFEDYPLPEDYDLQAYLPLLPCLKRYRFKEVSCSPESFPPEDQRFVRASRMVSLGMFLASKEFKGKKMIACKDCKDLDSSSSKFSFEAVEHKLKEELIRELESWDILSSSEEEEENERDEEVERTERSSGGILKQEQEDSKKSDKGPKKRTNVAMAAIMRQANRAAVGGGPTDQQTSGAATAFAASGAKQVSFKTPSPAPQGGSSQDSGSNMSQDSGGGGGGGVGVIPSKRGGGEATFQSGRRPSGGAAVAAFEVPPRFLAGGGGRAQSFFQSPSSSALGAMPPSPSSGPPQTVDFSVPPPPIFAQHQSRPAEGLGRLPLGHPGGVGVAAAGRGRAAQVPGVLDPGGAGGVWGSGRFSDATIVAGASSSDFPPPSFHQQQQRRSPQPLFPLGGDRGFGGLMGMQENSQLLNLLSGAQQQQQQQHHQEKQHLNRQQPGLSLPGLDNQLPMQGPSYSLFSGPSWSGASQALLGGRQQQQQQRQSQNRGSETDLSADGQSPLQKLLRDKNS